MSYLTIDQLIEKLQELKEAGLPGDSAVAIPSLDNNGRSGYMQRVEGVGRVAVAKSDFEKGWPVCKTVSVRGIEIIAIQ